MPPRSRKPEVSLDEILQPFVDRLENQQFTPNINRLQLMSGPQLEFFSSLIKNRILFGGNQAGKTFSGVYDDVMILLHRHPHRQHLYGDGKIFMRFIGVDFDRGIDQGAIPKFQQMLPPSALINGSWEDSYQKSSHMLSLTDGSTVSFMSYEQDPNKFQIVTLHHIHFDEEPPKPIFDESMPRLVRYNGTWTLTETPVQQLEWIQDELMEPAESGARPDVKVFYLDTRRNVHLSADAVVELLRGYTAEDFTVRVLGGYKAGSLVFPEFERRYPNVIPQSFLPTGEGWVVYASMDYGYSNPTAWLWTAVHRDGSIVTFRMLYAPSTTVEQWAAAVHAMNRQIGIQLGLGEDWEPAAYFGDPNISARNNGITGTTIQQEYALHGIPIGTDGIVKARSGNQNIGLDKMHTYLTPRGEHRRSAATGELNEPWWQITENCLPLIDEMKRARKPKQTLKMKEERNSSEEIRDKDNHAIDAQKYLFIITHDLRPTSPEDGAPPFRWPQEMGPTSAPAVMTHRDVYDTVAAQRPQLLTGGNGDYSELEH